MHTSRATHLATVHLDVQDLPSIAVGCQQVLKHAKAGARVVTLHMVHEHRAHRLARGARLTWRIVPSVLTVEYFVRLTRFGPSHRFGMASATQPAYCGAPAPAPSTHGRLPSPAASNTAHAGATREHMARRGDVNHTATHRFLARNAATGSSAPADW